MGLKILSPTPIGPGLERLFSEGEMLPWKGIEFRVAKVEHSKLELVPVRMTAAKRKEISGGN